jgi:hypothetical protein
MASITKSVKSGNDDAWLEVFTCLVPVIVCKRLASLHRQNNQAGSNDPIWIVASGCNWRVAEMTGITTQTSRWVAGARSSRFMDHSC